MPGMDGLEATRRIMQRVADAHRHGDGQRLARRISSFAFEAFQAGILAIVEKPTRARSGRSRRPPPSCSERSRAWPSLRSSAAGARRRLQAAARPGACASPRGPVAESPRARSSSRSAPRPAGRRRCSQILTRLPADFPRADPDRPAHRGRLRRRHGRTGSSRSARCRSRWPRPGLLPRESRHLRRADRAAPRRAGAVAGPDRRPAGLRPSPIGHDPVPVGGPRVRRAGGRHPADRDGRRRRDRPARDEADAAPSRSPRTRQARSCSACRPWRSSLGAADHVLPPERIADAAARRWPTAPSEARGEHLMAFDASAFLDDFRAEAADRVRELDAQLLALERDPSDPSPIREMFLAAHTIKGGAGDARTARRPRACARDGGRPGPPPGPASAARPRHGRPVVLGARPPA